MNESLEVIKSLYKPLKYTIKGKTMILHTTSGDYIVKEKHNDIKTLYRYLQNRNFYNFPKLIDDTRKELNVYEMIEDNPIPPEQKMDDLINVVSKLHNKTSYHKEVTVDTYQEIYESIKSNIDYLNNLYNEYYDIYLSEIMPSPSISLLLQNISKIFASLNFCSSNLDEWYELVKEEKKQRVSIIHNNLDTSHLISNKDSYLISWDYAKVDTPILDIVNLYHQEFFNYDFSTIIENYFQKVDLNESEKKLFFILIALPPKIEILDNEYESIKNIRSKLDYIFKTEDLLRPYYSKDQKEE